MRNEVTLLLSLFLVPICGTCDDQKPRSISAGYGYGTLPQIADGQYWKTSIILANLDSTTSSWKVEFFGDNGNPKEFTLAGRGRATVFSGTLTKYGSATLETLGGPGELNQGWARVSSPNYGDVGAMVIFGTSGIPGRADLEASVPGGRGDDNDSMIPFDNTIGFATSVALLNSASYDTVVDAYVLDEQGLALAVPERITLKPGTKIAFATADRWAVSKNIRGSIFIDNLNGNISSLALRFNPSGAFTTVFPMSLY
ncbi:hypothetical protein [uncultured Paludibaculum sp.]|uniref:hypothetical protein n=1 Tax=uncultured Paludibaculum sp. TaxID=1765020 RepID=UPI002AAB4BCB|nr:hypothetical protein [uncultured Paludibaculum sp.]